VATNVDLEAVKEFLETTLGVREVEFNRVINSFSSISRGVIKVKVLVSPRLNKHFLMR
jgi:hypothetical protein